MAGGDGSSGEPLPNAPAPIHSVVVDRKIEPGGGRIDIGLPGGHCVLIEVTPGVLQREIAFQVTAVDPALVPADTCNSCPDGATKRLCKTTVAYDLKGWYTDTGQEVGLEPLPGQYSHVVCYSDADVALADNNPDNLVIAYYDQGKGAWVDVPSEVDQMNKNVGVLADHLSYWVLMATRPCTSTTTARLSETGEVLSPLVDS